MYCWNPSLMDWNNRWSSVLRSYLKIAALALLLTLDLFYEELPWPLLLWSLDISLCFCFRLTTILPLSVMIRAVGTHRFVVRLRSIDYISFSPFGVVTICSNISVFCSMVRSFFSRLLDLYSSEWITCLSLISSSFLSAFAISRVFQKSPVIPTAISQMCLQAAASTALQKDRYITMTCNLRSYAVLHVHYTTLCVSDNIAQKTGAKYFAFLAATTPML